MQDDEDDDDGDDVDDDDDNDDADDDDDKNRIDVLPGGCAPFAIIVVVIIITHGNYLVTKGGSPLLYHGYNHTIIRHQALTHHLI